jgi:5-methyltetrahydropteroyltriglutamate--homocysteine methyltransferase
VIVNGKALRTAVVGSYSVPKWLERARTDAAQHRFPGEILDEMCDVVVKAAIKDQELAGIDVISDGELRRDNMLDHFTERLVGVEVDRRQKTYYYDFAAAVVRRRLPMAPLGLAEELRFAQRLTDREVKFSITGPHLLVKRIQNEAYADEASFAQDLARTLNLELRALVQAGATFIQIDEPYWSGFPEDLEWAVEALNVMVEGVQAHLGLHVCYGNRYGRPSWDGSYRCLFPWILDAHVDQLLLEFARKGTDDLALFEEFPNSFELGMGVIDVKDYRVETPDEVASRLRLGLAVVPPARLWANPDCGLHHLPSSVALAKLQALVQGAEIVRRELDLD